MKFIGLTLFIVALSSLQKTKATENSENLIDVSQQAISYSLLSLSDSIDSFFGDEELILNHDKKTKAIISLTHTLAERAKPESLVKVRIKLRLPRTKSRLNLVVDNISDELRNNEVSESDFEKIQEESQENDLTTSLKYIVQESEKWDISTKAGIKIKIPLDPFTSIRAQRNISFFHWKLTLAQNIFWFQSRGLGEVSRIDFERPVFKKSLFRFSNSASWLKDEDFFRFNHSLTIFQPLNHQAGLSYSAGISSNSDPRIHLDSYSLSVSYRRRLWRKWLFFDIIPGIQYPKSINFAPNYSMIFRLESIFGDMKNL